MTSLRTPPVSTDDIATLQADLAEGWGVPSTWYFDPDHYAFELGAITKRSWLLFAPVHQLNDPGDTVTGHVGDVPVVVVRGSDGALRGFVNLCRHRGYTVATQSGKCSVLTCRYHSWTYNLDGTLRAAPNSKDEPGFDKSALSLIPVAVDVLGPAVFVNLDADAPPLAQAHPRLAQMMQAAGVETDPDYYLESYNVVREIEYDFASNWKLWYDNNTECYHCPTIHSGTFGEAFETLPGSFGYDEMDKLMIFAFHPDIKRAEPGKMRARKQNAFQIYPGATIMLQDDILLLHQAQPTGPETTTKRMFCLTRNAGDQDMAHKWIELWNQTFKEDQGATQIQQAGLRSGQMPRARYVPSQEQATVYVNKLTLDAYAAAARHAVQEAAE